jgi:hypothetical protein
MLSETNIFQIQNEGTTENNAEFSEKAEAILQEEVSLAISQASQKILKNKSPPKLPIRRDRPNGPMTPEEDRSAIAPKFFVSIPLERLWPPARRRGVLTRAQVLQTFIHLPERQGLELERRRCRRDRRRRVGYYPVSSHDSDGGRPFQPPQQKETATTRHHISSPHRQARPV